MKEDTPFAGHDFYQLLYADPDFCSSLGRVMLAAARLETLLKKQLIDHGLDKTLSRTTLGHIVALLKDHKLMPREVPALELLRTQRNYLAHNLHALLVGFIEETILEGVGLSPADVHLYAERAWELANNLNGFAELTERKEGMA